MYKSILVAIDGQELSNQALTQAIGLAKALGAKLTVFTVTPRWSAGAAGGDVVVMYPPEAHQANIAETAKQLLNKIGGHRPMAGVLCDTAHASDAHPDKAILQYGLNEETPLIVMGSHGRRGIAGLLLGSETQKTLTMSHSGFSL